jgi:hypothetical protein
MMDAEEVHVAHPRLYGAPAYARPPMAVTPAARPLHPDDLPIAAEQTPEDRAIAELAMDSRYGIREAPAAEPDSRARSQPLRLGRLADKILRRAS